MNTEEMLLSVGKKCLKTFWIFVKENRTFFVDQRIFCMFSDLFLYVFCIVLAIFNIYKYLYRLWDAWTKRESSLGQILQQKKYSFYTITKMNRIARKQGMYLLTIAFSINNYLYFSLENLNDLNTDQSEPLGNLHFAPDSPISATAEVLDLTHNHSDPFRLRFDDQDWQKHLPSLKPLGLAILLNTCHIDTQVCVLKKKSLHLCIFYF